MRLVACADIDRFPQCFTISGFDGTTIYHYGRSVVPSERHDYAGHVLVTTGDRNAGVMVLGAGYSFDGVGDYLAGLKGEAHALSNVVSRGSSRDG